MTSAAVVTTGTSALPAYEPSLDGMRGICIAAVVVYHAGAVAGLDGWMRGGFLGVSVFFTLSGFLITSLLLREHASTGALDLTTFWARRIRRLWPAACTVVSAVVLLSAWGPLSARPSDAIAATWSMTNWHVIAGGDEQLVRTIVGPLGPTWSLAVEEQFYVVLALAFVVVTRLRAPRTALTAVAVVGVVAPVVLAQVVTDWHPSLEFSTVLRMPELFMGVLLAIWRSRSQQGGRGKPLGRTAGDLLAGAGVAILVVLFLFVDHSPPWLLRGGFAAVAVVSAATIVGLLQRGSVAHVVAAAPLRWLGTISYSLYLVHWPVYLTLTSDRVGLDGIALASVALLAAIAVAWGLHVAVERRIRRMDTAPIPTIVTGLVAAAALTIVSLVVL